MFASAMADHNVDISTGWIGQHSFHPAVAYIPEFKGVAPPHETERINFEDCAFACG